MNIALAAPVTGTWMHGGWGWGWMSLMMVLMVLFWGAIIAGIVWLIRGGASGRPVAERAVSKETPSEILDRRFAEGELSEEDYRARREVLERRSEPLVGA